MVFDKSSRARIVGLVAFLTLGSALSAAPRLNLDQTAFALSIAQGANGPTQTANARNTGSGSLTLTLSSSVSWLAPTLGKSQTTSCGVPGVCIPVQIAIQSSSLTKGIYTGTVTVSDPNAQDAPQFITVTLRVGGAVPDKLEYYVAPGSSASSTFVTASPVASSINNAPWFSLAVNGQGSFTFNVPYIVTARASSGMAANDYNGTLTLSGSSLTADNKQIPVTMHVTTQPILQASPSSMQITIAQGANKQTSANGALQYISTTNSGQGTLTLSNVSATSSGGNWLTASTVAGYPFLVAVSADPSGLSPGVYQGAVTIASNAANSSVQVPVQLTVETQTSPIVFAGRVTNNGTFAPGETLAQGDIVAVFGDQFSYGDPAVASSLPLGTSLGDVQVLVNGSPAPVFYVGAGQIDFEIPIDAAAGDGTVQIVRSGTKSNLAYVNIAKAAPRFLLLGGGPYVIMTTPGGALTGIPGQPAKAGDVVVIYVIGLGPTSPVVPSGTASPSDPAATVPGATQVCFDGHSIVTKPICTTPAFVGLTPGLVGLYQINVAIPAGLPSGDTAIVFTAAGETSDQELITLQ